MTLRDIFTKLVEFGNSLIDYDLTNAFNLIIGLGIIALSFIIGAWIIIGLGALIFKILEKVVNRLDLKNKNKILDSLRSIVSLILLLPFITGFIIFWGISRYHS